MELMAEKLKKKMGSRWARAADYAADALVDKIEKQWVEVSADRSRGRIS